MIFAGPNTARADSLASLRLETMKIVGGRWDPQLRLGSKLVLKRGNVMLATLRGSPVRHRATRGVAAIEAAIEAAIWRGRNLSLGSALRYHSKSWFVSVILAARVRLRAERYSITVKC